MKDRKYELQLISSHSYSEIEEKLAKMAKKGWLLEKIGSFLWTYRRIEPQKLTFCVCCFPKASAFDPEPSEEQQTFLDFCRQTGWTLAASAAQVQIFCNETEDPVPIETDPMTEVDAISRSIKRSSLAGFFVLFGLAILNGVLFLNRLHNDPIGVLSSKANLFTGLCWALMILMNGVEIANFYIWHHRAVRAAEQGIFLESGSRRYFQRFCLAVLTLGLGCYFWSVFTSGDKLMHTAVILMFCLYLPGLYFLVYGIKTFLKRKKAPAGVNRTVTLVSAFAVGLLLIGGITLAVLSASARGWFAGADDDVYKHNGITFTAHHDALPLTVEDLLGVQYDGYNREARTEETFLLAHMEFYQHPRFDAADYREMPELEYDITLIKVPALYDICKKAILNDWARWREDCAVTIPPDDWSAVEVHQMTDRNYGPGNRFLLCYPDRIIEIWFAWEPSPEQMKIAGEKLGLTDPARLLQ